MDFTSYDNHHNDIFCNAKPLEHIKVYDCLTCIRAIVRLPNPNATWLGTKRLHMTWVSNKNRERHHMETLSLFKLRSYFFMFQFCALTINSLMSAIFFETFSNMSKPFIVLKIGRDAQNGKFKDHKILDSLGYSFFSGLSLFIEAHVCPHAYSSCFKCFGRI